MSFVDGIVIPSVDSDGKQRVITTPATKGFGTFFTGAGDQLSPLVRGGGQKIRLSWDAVEARGAKSIDIQFGEPVEMHDGQAFYSPTANWTPDDSMSVSSVLPATTTVANGGGTGNCNRVASGLGYDVVVPAAGNGAHDVDLAVAVPIISDTFTGYWDVDRVTGVITPAATPGQGGFNLITVEVSAYFLRNVPLGSPLGTFDIETYGVEWFHNTWKLRVTVDKQSAGAGDFAGWLLLFRKTRM